MSAAQQLVPALPDEDESDFALSSLTVFTKVPKYNHDVVVLLGAVLVYETDSLSREETVNGALYVVENQQPVGGMSWELYDRFNREHGPREPRVRISTSRRVIRAVRCDDAADLWWQVQPSGYRDGPYRGWGLASNFVGKVVGVYQPGGHRPDAI